MNKLLLILITLLVAAQSYAQSVKFEFIARESSEYPNLNSSVILVTSSIPLFAGVRQNQIIRHENVIKFSSENPLFVKKDENKEQLEQLMSILRKIVHPDELKTEEDVLLKNRISYSMGTLVSFVETVMIKHGFSVTIREKTKDESRGRNYEFVWEYYFFKP
jgi:hypothetical protein